MGETDTEQARYYFAIGSVALGVVLSLTIVGAIIGVPLAVVGVVLFAHTWWKDFDETGSKNGDVA